MKKIVLLIVMLFSFCVVNAQNIQKEGNTFVQVTKKAEAKETLTSYTYKDSKNNVYKIYLSSTGKAYIKKTSKKTNKEYKQYLPEVGKQINPEAYKEKKSK